MKNKNIELECQDLSFFYPASNTPSLQDINLVATKNKVLSLIGPSGCGKSTLLRCFNQMHSLYKGSKYKGKILHRGKNILSKKVDIITLRENIGMIFQHPTAFPMSIFDNIAYGLRLKGIKDKSTLEDKVITALKQAALFKEVKDKLYNDALSLSGGQQQRLCIARAVAIEPYVLLFDEPTSALDPISSRAIEDLVIELKKKMTIIIVTHNMQQAQRVGDFAAFMYLGKLIEHNSIKELFNNPSKKLTKDYIGGNFG